MHPILDEVPQSVNTKQTFARLSLIFGLLTAGLMWHLTNLIPKTPEALVTFQGIPNLLNPAIQLCLLIGVVTTILSFVKKKQSSLAKWVGLIINLIIFGMMLTSSGLAYAGF